MGLLNLTGDIVTRKYDILRRKVENERSAEAGGDRQHQTASKVRKRREWVYIANVSNCLSSM